MWSKPLLTFDTNVAIYAFSDDGAKAEAARIVIERADFISIQVLNEFANAVRRKQNRPWSEIKLAVDRIRRAVPKIVSLDEAVHLEAIRLVERYQFGLYDALLIGAALLNGGRTFYSEDLQHGMSIDETLRIVNPFVSGALDA
jgi:predicted nucleic acid-binding protein